MNARELHDKLSRSGANPDLAEFCAGHATILRALDLLDRVEESEDELVRELREQHCRDFGSDPQCNMDNLCICDMHERAAAALVALKAERDDWHKVADSRSAELIKVSAERDEWKDAALKNHYLADGFRIERDRLKECVWKLRGEILDMASRGMYTQKSAEAAEDAFALLSNATEEE